MWFPALDLFTSGDTRNSLLCHYRYPFAEHSVIRKHISDMYKADCCHTVTQREAATIPEYAEQPCLRRLNDSHQSRCTASFARRGVCEQWLAVSVRRRAKPPRVVRNAVYCEKSIQDIEPGVAVVSMRVVIYRCIWLTQHGRHTAAQT
jgi:hypothetical protein